MESLVHAHQAQYYQAINDSTTKADSCLFVEFMLTMILSTLREATLEVERLVAILTKTTSRLQKYPRSTENGTDHMKEPS